MKIKFKNNINILHSISPHISVVSKFAKHTTWVCRLSNLPLNLHLSQCKTFTEKEVPLFVSWKPISCVFDEFLILLKYEFFTLFKDYYLRHNFLLVAHYSLKFTRCSLLLVKSLVIRCKICLLLVAKAALCKKLLVTRCKIRLLPVAEVT